MHTPLAWGNRPLIILIVLAAVDATWAQSLHPTAWGAVPAGMPSDLTCIAIDAGENHGLALKSDGTVLAWGSNIFGQTNVPAGLAGVAAIAAGSNHSLALKNDGTVTAWGGNPAGESTVPTGLNAVAAVAAGANHSVALKNDGTIVAWGEATYGKTTPPSGLRATAISAGYAHTAALKSDGTVVGWGYNGEGETNVPTGLTGVVAIAAGGYHTLALKSDGTVVAWGYNPYGQTNVPSGLAGVVAIAAGGFHSMALKNDGTVVAWGYNAQGQSTVPAGLSGVVAIAAGGQSSFALAPQATPPQITITAAGGMQRNPLAGVAFSVSGDGCQPGSYVTPQALQWTPSSTCTVSLTSLYSASSDTRYLFAGWADNGASSNVRTFVAPNTSTNYRADYSTEYLVTTTAVTKDNLGPIVNGGTITPQTGWFNETPPVASVTVQATASPGFVFTGFSGDLTGTQNPQQIAILHPYSITANFMSIAEWRSHH
jgi:hypothetical protein